MLAYAGVCWRMLQVKELEARYKELGMLTYADVC